MLEYNTANQPEAAPPEPSASAPQPQLPTPPSASAPTHPSLHDPTTPALPHSAPVPHPSFSRSPGETPRAFSAFLTFFQLGHTRSLQAVADRLGESLGTVKNWSSRFDWMDRVLNFNFSLLQQEAEAQAALHARQAADWAARLERFRDQEWDAAQKLLAAAQCFLESFGEEDLRRMTLAQVARALKISSAVGRLALAGAELPPAAEPTLAPIQHQLLDAMKRVYGVERPAPVNPSLNDSTAPALPHSAPVPQPSTSHE